MAKKPPAKKDKKKASKSQVKSKPKKPQASKGIDDMLSMLTPPMPGGPSPGPGMNPPPPPLAGVPPMV